MFNLNSLSEYISTSIKAPAAKYMSETITTPLANTIANGISYLLPGASSKDQYNSAREDLGLAQKYAVETVVNSKDLVTDVTKASAIVGSTVGGSFGLFKSAAEINSALYVLELGVFGFNGAVAATRGAVVAAAAYGMANPLAVPVAGAVAGAVLAHDEVLDACKQTVNLTYNGGLAAKSATTSLTKGVLGHLVELKEYLNPDLQNGSNNVDHNLDTFTVNFDKSDNTLKAHLADESKKSLEKQQEILEKSNKDIFVISKVDGLESNWVEVESLFTGWTEITPPESICDEWVVIGDNISE